MTTPKSSEPIKDSTDRFRTILNSPNVEEPDDFEPPARPKPDVEPARPKSEPAPAARLKPDPKPAPAQPAAAASSPLSRLPRAKPVDSAPPPVTPPPAAPSTADSDQGGESGPKSRKFRFGPAFWTVTGILSLIVNAVLIAIVLILIGTVAKLNLKLDQLTVYAKLPEDTVRGLYENFVKMDDAHIRTTIPVSAEIPVQFNLDINTQTEVVLSQDTPIQQARVSISTGTMNIVNAPANIVLPAGTRLPVTLTLTVPVDKRVPVNLLVNVDIPLSQTDLHDPFVGLQNVVQPLYCLLNPKATTANGVLLCPPTMP